MLIHYLMLKLILTGFSAYAMPHIYVTPYLTVGDIINVISSLNNSSAGYDEMPALILKNRTCIDEYIHPITYLVKLSITRGTFPNELKLAKVASIFKSDNQQLINKYRQISVLPFFSEIYEKVKTNFLIIVLEAHGILSNFQFRHKRSTNHVIITPKAFDIGKMYVVYLLTLEKLLMLYQTLPKKLYSYGIHGNLYYWFESCLSERSRYVEFQNT